MAEPIKYADSSTLESKAFGVSREIMVSLPASYEKSTSTRYPVIYIVRGQLDVLAVLAAINMLDSEAPEFIVVGVNASGEEFIPNKDKGQGKFSQLLHSEVVPHIEKEYRTAPYSILVGHSAAGKFVINDWLARGSDFSSYYAISPELNDGLINSRAKALDQESLFLKSPLLVSMGSEGKRMQSMFDELKELKRLSQRAKFIQFKDQTHMSGRVHTVMAGLRSSFKNWRPSKKVESGRLEELQAHYLDLSERYGYKVNIPLETMKRESAFHSASNIQERWQIASNIVKYALSKTPSDIDEFLDIADEMIGYGMSEGSERLVSFVCQQAPKHSRCVDQYIAK
jgi:predicted alpha/beta superfamily hydrolase